MISAYHAVISFQGVDIVSLLEKISLSDIFDDLIQKYKEDNNLLQCIIKYIVMAYSKDSDKVIADSDWLSNKKRIYDDAILPPIEETRNNVLYLRDQSVVEAIHKWLEFQDSDAFTQLQVLKDLKVEMQVSANSAIKKSSGEVDYSQKYLNSTYAMDLSGKIKALESELMQNDVRFKEAVREVKSFKNKTTLGVELFIK